MSETKSIHTESEWDFEDFNAVDFDVDTTEDLFETQVVEPGPINFANMDFLGVFGFVPEIKVEIPHFTPMVMPKRQANTESPKVSFERWSSLYFSASEGLAYVHSLGLREVCGRSKVDIPPFKLFTADPFELADVYAEEISGKGSGLGFSSFVHLAAVMMISRSCKSITEPANGYDVDWLDPPCTIEITGINFQKRRSNADMVLNKYALLCHLDLNEFSKWCIQMSRKEELCLTDGFVGSSYDMPDTDYTPAISQLHHYISQLEIRQAEVLSQWVMKYVTELPKFDLPESKNETNVYKEIHHSAKKQFDNTMKLICPHKVVCARNYEPDLHEDNLRKSVFVHALLPNFNGYRTTFHTEELDCDYIAHSIAYSEFKPRPQLRKSNIDDHLMDYLMKYKTFQNIRINNDLFMRISGKKGCYFSVVHQVGLAWERHASDIAYHCIYYTFSEIDGVGQWAKFDNYYRSSSFVLSQQDIRFASALLGRVLTMVTTVMNNATDHWAEIEKALMQIAYTWLDSSWFTTTLCSDYRFTTTGHMSGNDVTDLIVRNLKSKRPLRACDLMLLRLAEKHMKGARPRSVTPMFGLPLRFHCLEKDLALGMNWHIRKAQHETNCCKKMLAGAVDELAFRPKVVAYYFRQVEFMKSVYNGSATYADLKYLLDTAPETPAINVPFMAAMVYESKESLQDSASNQTSTQFSLNNMLSDRGMTNYSNGNVTAKKVVDEMTIHIKLADVKGPYGLLYSESHGQKIPQIFAISAKDASKSDREISAMLRTMRCSQFFSECMQSTVSRAMPEDALLDSEKYCPMVRSISNLLSKRTRVYAMSEDRSFHSGNNHPEAMSLVSALVGRLAGVPPMISSASLQRCWKSRKVVLPVGFASLDKKEVNDDTKEALSWLPSAFSWVNRFRNKKQTKVPMVELQYHMMQGIQAIAAGVINTIYNTGMMNIISKASKVVEDHYIITTSDDVGRVVQMKDGVGDQIKDLVVYKPLECLKFSSQLNNWRKLVVVENDGIVEVNNITTAACGMIPQTFIHSVLAIQPLNGESILVDIMNVVAQSRQTIFWGDGPTLAMSALVNGVRMIMNKWLMSRSQVDELYSLGLLPKSINELIEGFFPRTEISLRGFIAITPREKRPQILNNTRSLYTSAVRYLRAKVQVEEEEPTIAVIPISLTFDLKRLTILNARANQGRLRAAYTRPYSINTKLAHLSKFFQLFKSLEEIDLEPYRYLQPPNVHVIFRPMQLEDRLPRSMGMSSIRVKESIRAILGRRILNIVYRQPLTEMEIDIADTKDENEFKERIQQLRFQKNVEGFSTTSPSGLPPVRFYGTTKFTYLQCFNFSVEVLPQEYKSRPFEFNGHIVRDFKPQIWGAGSLKESGLIRCFATGYIGENRLAFYKKIRGKVSSIRAEIENVNMVRVQQNNGKVIAYLNKEDRSPIHDPEEEHESSFPGLTGDTCSILNYGQYLHTNNNSGFACFQRIFRKKGSEYPWFCKDQLPPFPQFSPDAVEVTGGRFHITGNQYIGKFRAKFMGEQEVFMDVSVNPPRTLDHEDEGQFEDW